MLKSRWLAANFATQAKNVQSQPTQKPGLTDKELRSQVKRTVANEEDAFCSKVGVMIKKPSRFALLLFDQAEWKHLGHIGTLPLVCSGAAVWHYAGQTHRRALGNEDLYMCIIHHTKEPLDAIGRRSSSSLKKTISSFLCWYMWWWNCWFWSCQCWKLSLKMCKAFALK